MKKVGISCLVVVAFALAAAGAFCAGEVRQYKVPSRFPEDLPPSRLSVYLPEGYEASGISYPVLYLVHGAGGNNTTFFGGGYGRTFMADVNAAGIVDKLVGEARIKPLIVACPDMTGATSSPDDLLTDVAAFVDASFRTRPNRESRAIAGHSMGATAALAAALKNPRAFSLAAGLAAYLPGPYLTRLEGLAKKIPGGEGPIQVWLYAGTRDEETPALSSRSLAAVLEQSGVKAEYVEDDGDHTSGIARRLEQFIEFAAARLAW